MQILDCLLAMVVKTQYASDEAANHSLNKLGGTKEVPRMGQLRCKFARRKIAAERILGWTRRSISRRYANFVARRVPQYERTRWVLPTYILRNFGHMPPKMLIL
jgi:hypothetical protein